MTPGPGSASCPVRTRFRWGILTGGSYSIRNGTRLARQVQIIAPAGASITNLVVNAEPIGSLSLENVGLFDLRVAKRFGLGLGKSLEFASTATT